MARGSLRSRCSMRGSRAVPVLSASFAQRLIELLSDERYRDDVEPS